MYYQCENCDTITYDWCNWCQINNLIENFGNWTSENEKIDDFIQEMQLEIDENDDTVVEWISYNQFIDIKEVGKDDNFATLYLAIWKDGPLYYDYKNKKEWIKWIKDSNKKVALKSINNSQNLIESVINEV